METCISMSFVVLESLVRYPLIDLWQSWHWMVVLSLFGAILWLLILLIVGPSVLILDMERQQQEEDSYTFQYYSFTYVRAYIICNI